MSGVNVVGANCGGVAGEEKPSCGIGIGVRSAVGLPDGGWLRDGLPSGCTPKGVGIIGIGGIGIGGIGAPWLWGKGAGTGDVPG